MPRVTALEKTRIWLIAITLLAPLTTCAVVLWQDSRERSGYLPYPIQSALFNIAAAYLPILIIVFGFLWTLGKRPRPPKGDAVMDMAANVVAVVVFAITLGIPILIYGRATLADDANTSMVMYSAMMHTLLSTAMIYYFGKPLVNERKAGQERVRTPATRQTPRPTR